MKFRTNSWRLVCKSELLAALWRYGHHEKGCPVIVSESMCTCGLTEIRGLRDVVIRDLPPPLDGT